MVTKRHTLWTFYVAVACLGALIALTGFSRRYILPLSAGRLHAPAIVHFHGLITFTWLAFVILQSLLVATRRSALHRSIGMAGISLGTLLVFTATLITLLQLSRELKGGAPSPREFAATLLSLSLLITGLLVVAFATVTRPEVHKRLIVLATLVILTPALARIIQLVAPSLSRLARNDLASVASDALILLALAYDARVRGTPHPAYLIGSVWILAVQGVALLVRHTTAWYGVTDRLASLVG